VTDGAGTLLADTWIYRLLEDREEREPTGAHLTLDASSRSGVHVTLQRSPRCQLQPG
jgi:hypothetical protein